MKLTSLNLLAFNNWDKRQPVILDYLRTENPDIILFQEVVYLPVISPYNQVQILNQHLNYPHEHSSVTRLQDSPDYDVFREGLAVLSRYTVVKTDTIILKQAAGDEHNRIVQCIDVDMNGQLVKLANIQFSLTDTVDFATAHLEETLEIIRKKGEERIIIGDFNMNHLEDLSYMWSDTYKASTSAPYISYPSMNKRNDYVLIPKSYSFVSIVVSGDGLSDHRALTVEIEPLKSA
ncbi:MAG: endonuclease/exonuclease/phosphatase family protein [Candidatus Saccharimonadales bacterium]